MSMYAKRVDRLRASLTKLGAHSIFVTSKYNVTYLTGFTGEDSYLWISRDELKLISDPRYEVQISEECPDLDVCIRKPSELTLDVASRVIASSRVPSVLIEGSTMTVSQHEKLKGMLRETEVGVAENLVEEIRQVKDAGEIERIRRAISLAERTWYSVKSRLKGTQTERDIANEIESTIRHLGGKGTAFSTIVGVGPRSALPHGIPSEKRLEESPFCLVDFGANEGLYLSDLTRVLVTGRIPAKFARVYQLVLDSHRNAARSLRPGAIPSEVDRIARKTLEDGGVEKRFNHGLGHGFGMEIHESPRLNKNLHRPLEAGMVITIEPGVYFPGWGGVRIEDDYLITNDGCERLSSLPQDLEANQVVFL